MASPKTILFVCTGNLCRSPMAMALLRKQLSDAGLDGRFRVESAGTWAAEGAPASPYACQVMAERGLDLSGHRTRDISHVSMDEVALVLVMTRHHREAILAEFPSARGKTFLLSELAGMSYDIADPYGNTLDTYRYCADELEDLISRGFRRIIELAGGAQDESSA